MNRIDWEAFAERVPAGTMVIGIRRGHWVWFPRRKHGWTAINRKRGILLGHQLEQLGGYYGIQIMNCAVVQFFECEEVHTFKPQELAYRLGTGRKKWLTFAEIMA